MIFLCLGVGYLLRRFKQMPENTPAVLNSFIIYISLPATALISIHSIALEKALLYPVSLAWFLFFLSLVLFVPLGKALRWDPKITGALILTAGLGNTSFVGFPLLEAFYGPNSLSIGTLVDQPGSFLVLSSLGIAVASFYTGTTSSVSAVIRKVAAFPPFIALVFALLLHGWTYPEWLSTLLQKLSATVIPLALVSVGFQMNLKAQAVKNYRAPLFWGLLFKLTVGPLICALIYVGLLGARGPNLQIALTETAMAPMISAAILASDYGLDPELSNLMVAIGIPISLITVPLWVYCTRWI
jgi:predicted permease